MDERRGNALCIFCYRPASSLDINHGGNETHKVLQILSRYLNIDLNPQDDLITSEFLSCDNCYELGETLCDLFFQLENLRLQLEWKLKTLFETMRTAGRIPSRVQNFRAQFQNEWNDSEIVFRNIQELRSGVFGGCKKKLSSSLPKVLLKKITQDKEDDCEIVTKEVVEFVPFDANQVLEGLMTFVAVIHLSLPLHPHAVPRSYHSQSHNNPKEKHVRVGKPVQTGVSAFCPRNEAENNDSLPPILTPFDFYDDDDENDGVDFAPIVNQLQNGAVNASQSSSNLVAPASNSAIKCQICYAFFDSVVLLTLHMRSIHKSEIPFECPQSECNYHTKSTVAFRLHMRRVHKSVTGIPGHFQCDVCKERFSSVLTLQRHANLHRETPQDRFNCGRCSQSFETKTKLRSHIYHLHGQSQRRKIRRKPNLTNSKSFNSYSREVVVISCPICRVPFKDYDILETHLKLVHQRLLAYDCAHCNRKLKTVEGFRSHTHLTHGKLFQSNRQLLSASNVKCSCTVADNTPIAIGADLIVSEVLVNNPAVAVQNSVAHENPIQNVTRKMYRCSWPGCERKYASSWTRSRHYKTHIDGNSGHETFDRTGKRQRENDIRRKDTIEDAISANPLVENIIANFKSPQIRNNNVDSTQRNGSFRCNFEGCSKAYTMRHNLQSHYRTHTGEKPFLCWWPGCASKFTRRDCQKAHYKRHTKQPAPSRVHQHDKHSTAQVMVRKKWIPGRGSHIEEQKSRESSEGVVERTGVCGKVSKKKTLGGSADSDRREKS